MKKFIEPTIGEINNTRSSSNACVEGKGQGNICSQGGR